MNHAGASEAEEAGDAKVRDRSSNGTNAFCSYYEENFAELKRRGADLIYSAPCATSFPDVDGLYIGGGLFLSFNAAQAREFGKGSHADSKRRRPNDPKTACPILR